MTPEAKALKTEALTNRARITPDGAALGRHMVRLFVEPVLPLLAAESDPDTRCSSCAFRVGTTPNGCEQTVMDAMKCVLEAKPFYCHSHQDANGRYDVLCHGWVASQIARDGAPPIKAPWPFSHEIGEAA